MILIISFLTLTLGFGLMLCFILSTFNDIDHRIRSIERRLSRLESFQSEP